MRAGWIINDTTPCCLSVTANIHTNAQHGRGKLYEILICYSLDFASFVEYTCISVVRRKERLIHNIGRMGKGIHLLYIHDGMDGWNTRTWDRIPNSNHLMQHCTAHKLESKHGSVGFDYTYLYLTYIHKYVIKVCVGLDIWCESSCAWQCVICKAIITACSPSSSRSKRTAS